MAFTTTVTMRSVRPDLPNKPMVPTAPTHLNEHPSGSLRRHIGGPLGGMLPRTDARADRLLAPSFVPAMREGHVSIVIDVVAKALAR